MLILVERRQTMLFSATQTRRTEDLAKISLKKEPLYVGVDDTSDQATVEGLEQVNQWIDQKQRSLKVFSLGLCRCPSRQTFSSSLYFSQEKSEEKNDGLLFILYGCEVLQ